jgi:hypothetical protein
VIGYTPAEQAICASHGESPDTGADDPPAWHDQPFEGASSIGLPDGADATVLPEWWRP